MTAEKRMGAETAIRALIDGFTKAIREKDIDGVMSVFAADVVSFDLGPPLQHGGGTPSWTVGKSCSGRIRVRLIMRFAISASQQVMTWRSATV